MKKILLLPLFSVFFFVQASQYPGWVRTAGAVYSYFWLPKNTITFKTDDDQKIELPWQFINARPMRQKLINVLNQLEIQKDSTNPEEITNKDIQEINVKRSFISSQEIPELKQAWAIVLNALLELVKKQVNYSSRSESTAVPRYFTEYLTTRKSLPEEKRKELHQKTLIIKRLVYYDLPLIEPKLTTYSSLNIFNKEDRIREQLWNLIILLTISSDLGFKTIAAAVAQYIAQQYVTNIEKPSSENTRFHVPSDAQVRYKYFSDIETRVLPQFKRLILENALLQTESLERFLELLSTLNLPQNDPLLKKFTNFIMYSNLLKPSESVSSLLEPSESHKQQELSKNAIVKRRAENLKILAKFSDEIPVIRDLKKQVATAIENEIPKL